MIWFLLGTNWNCLILVCPRGSFTNYVDKRRQAGRCGKFQNYAVFPKFVHKYQRIRQVVNNGHNLVNVVKERAPTLIRFCGQVGSPEAIPGPTPFRVHRDCDAACRSPVFASFLKAFFVSCMATRGVFICTKLTKLGRNFPR